MIQQSKPHIRKLFVALLVVSMFLCPLAHGGFVRISSAEGERQIYPTVPPVDPTIPTPLGTTMPSLMPMPTLGPGQDFEDEEIDQSQINVLHGDDKFGYGQFLDNEDLYIMWITDEDGTHYLVVDEGNDVLFGKYDQLTGERREDESFMQFLIERTVKQNQLSEIEREIEGKEKLRDGLFFTGYVVLFGGLAICIFASAGACSIATPIVGTGGMGLAGTAVTEAVGVDNAMDRYNDKLKEIREDENTLLGRFTLAMNAN